MRALPDARHVEDSLFRCLGDIKSSIGFEEYCRSGCGDGATDGPDHCYPDPNTLPRKRHLDIEPTLRLD